jgi:predicted dehydrogenase
VHAAGGIPYAVAGRDLDRARHFAAENEIEHAMEGYANLLADDQVEAVYIALPNSLHAEWTIATLRAGKPVLCEKPLCISAAEVREVLQVAEETGTWLWEAFVFPFRNQTRRLQEIMASGTIGEIVEVYTNNHFQLGRRNDIRLDPALGGGALLDVGCYCIRLANLVFERDPDEAAALAQWAPEGVDEAIHAVLGYGDQRRLLFSGSFLQRSDQMTRVIGTEGEIRLTNPYHPTADDTLEVHAGGHISEESPSGPEPSFTDAIRHIQSVVRGEEEPRHLAVENSLGVAIGLDLVRDRAARTRPALSRG